MCFDAAGAVSLVVVAGLPQQLMREKLPSDGEKDISTSFTGDLNLELFLH